MNPPELVKPNQSSDDIADWNKIAEKYTTHDGYTDTAQNPMYRQLEAVLWECLGDLNGLNVLDLGCGDGWLSGLMQAAGAHVWALTGPTGYLRRRGRAIPASNLCRRIWPTASRRMRSSSTASYRRWC